MSFAACKSLFEGKNYQRRWCAYQYYSRQSHSRENTRFIGRLIVHCATFVQKVSLLYIKLALIFSALIGLDYYSLIFPYSPPQMRRLSHRRTNFPFPVLYKFLSSIISYHIRRYSISLQPSDLYSSEIIPTRCNNCVFILRNGFTLHVSGDNLTHHQEYICRIWPQVSRLT